MIKNLETMSQDEWIEQLFGKAKTSQPIDVDKNTPFDKLQDNMKKEAERYGEAVFYVGKSVVPASAFHPHDQSKITAIVWPSKWQYQPKPNGLAWLGCSVRGAK